MARFTRGIDAINSFLDETTTWGRYPIGNVGEAGKMSFLMDLEDSDSTGYAVYDAAINNEIARRKAAGEHCDIR